MGELLDQTKVRPKPSRTSVKLFSCVSSTPGLQGQQLNFSELGEPCPTISATLSTSPLDWLQLVSRLCLIYTSWSSYPQHVTISTAVLALPPQCHALASLGLFAETVTFLNLCLASVSLSNLGVTFCDLAMLTLCLPVIPYG